MLASALLLCSVASTATEEGFRGSSGLGLRSLRHPCSFRAALLVLRPRGGQESDLDFLNSDEGKKQTLLRTVKMGGGDKMVDDGRSPLLSPSCKQRCLASSTLVLCVSFNPRTFGRWSVTRARGLELIFRGERGPLRPGSISAGHPTRVVSLLDLPSHLAGPCRAVGLCKPCDHAGHAQHLV